MCKMCLFYITVTSFMFPLSGQPSQDLADQAQGTRERADLPDVALDASGQGHHGRCHRRQTGRQPLPVSGRAEAGEPVLKCTYQVGNEIVSSICGNLFVVGAFELFMRANYASSPFVIFGFIH